jgi:hypothetical protein
MFNFMMRNDETVSSPLCLILLNAAQICFVEDTRK